MLVVHGVLREWAAGHMWGNEARCGLPSSACCTDPVAAWKPANRRATQPPAPQPPPLVAIAERSSLVTTEGSRTGANCVPPSSGPAGDGPDWSRPSRPCSSGGRLTHLARASSGILPRALAFQRGACPGGGRIPPFMGPPSSFLGARLNPKVVLGKLFQCSRLYGRNKKSSKFVYPPTKPTRT